MPAQLFMNYRRNDLPDAAQALYALLRMQFGLDHIFMDVNTIQPGQPWPKRIQRSLSDASALLVLIGPKWLFAHDNYGRRRLDHDKDWVRLEIRTALKQRKTILPVLLDATMPPPEALPADIRLLSDCQCTTLRRDNWFGDVTGFARSLEQQGIAPARTGPGRNLPYPNPKIAKLPGLTEQELARALKTLDRWEPTRDFVVSEYPLERQELRRVLSFPSFPAAIAFMQEAADLCDRIPHHPRWSNEWKQVTIRLTTWDAGNKITTLDVKTAKALDLLVNDFRARWAARKRNVAPTSKASGRTLISRFR